MFKKKILGIILAAVIILASLSIFWVIKDSGASDTSLMEIEGFALAEPNESELPAVQEKPDTEPEKTDMEQALGVRRPALVTLRASGDGINYTVGSGFILDMQENIIYICTSRHVIEEFENWEIGFYDGSSATGTKIGVSQTYDVGIVGLDLEKVSGQLPDNLFSLELELEYWRQLEGKSVEAGFVSMYQEDSDKYVSGLLLNALEDYQWDNGLRHSLFQLTFTDGDSGSAIFDKTGHLIAMVHGTSYSSEADGLQRWGIPLSAIAVCYMEIVGG